MAPKRRKGRPTRRLQPSAGARPAPAPVREGIAAPGGFGWRKWLIRSVAVGVIVTVVNVVGNPPKHTDPGTLIPGIVESIVIWGGLFLAVIFLWEVVLRFRRRF